MFHKKLTLLVALTVAGTAQAQNLLTNASFDIDSTPFPEITDAPDGWTWRNFNGFHQQFGYIPYNEGGKHLHSVDFENWLQQAVPQTVQPGDILTFSAKVANINDLEDAGGLLEIANSAGEVLAMSVNANTLPKANLQTGPIYYDLSVTLDVNSLSSEQQATILGSQPLAVIHILGTDPEPYQLDSLNIYYDNTEFTIASAPSVVGDYNDNGTVDAADYVVWRNNEGTSNPLLNDEIGGMVGPAHYTQWRTNFGNMAGGGSVLAGGGRIAAAPEPSCLFLLALGLVGLATATRRPRG